MKNKMIVDILEQIRVEVADLIEIDKGYSEIIMTRKYPILKNRRLLQLIDDLIDNFKYYENNG